MGQAHTLGIFLAVGVVILIAALALFDFTGQTLPKSITQSSIGWGVCKELGTVRKIDYIPVSCQIYGYEFLPPQSK